jgi:FKBP-type peptidyl-prolyl cis-trans isomerase SlyD
MKIATNAVVTVTYELSIDGENGQRELLEVADQNDPMAFIHGQSGLPEAFEAELTGLSEGDSFDFSVPAESGYGPFDPEAIVELPVELFHIDGKLEPGLLEVGNLLPMTNDEGHRLQGRVVAVSDALVTMDFNHPLADKTMHFTGTVLAVRPATDSELSHGHVHGPGGVEH